MKDFIITLYNINYLTFYSKTFKFKSLKVEPKNYHKKPKI